MIEPKNNLSPDQSFAPPPPPWRQSAYNRPAMPTPPMPPMGGNFSGGSLPGVGDLLSQSWQIFISNAGTYIGIAILPIIIQIIGIVVLFLVLLGGLLLRGFIPLFKGDGVLTFPSLILLIVVGLVIGAIQILSQAALIYAAMRRDRKVGLGEAYGFALRKLFSFLWIIILSIVIIAGGSFLFIIPGILFAVWFIFASFVLIDEDTRGMSALLKSKEYMRGQWFAVFWRWLALDLFAWLISIPAGIAISVTLFIIKLIAGAVLGSTAGQYAGIIIGLFFLIPLQVIIVSLGIIYGSLIYGHLRAMRGSFEFNPSGGQKAGFLAIGIIGVLLPLLLFGAAIIALFSSFSGAKDLFKNPQINQNSLNLYQGIDNKNAANLNSADKNPDSDKDGITDSLETFYKTNPNIADTDFDGLSDGAEVNTWKTNPTNPDTDGDGFRDGDEVKNGYDPLGGGKTQNN